MVGKTDWKVVLIDDEVDILDVVSINLLDAGYEVATASNGEEGLDLCRSFSPQIVITDIRMPRLDGLEVLATIKRQTPEIEVIVATAFAEMDYAVRALQLDASDFVTKPVGDEALHLALKRAKERYTSRKWMADYTDFLEKQNAETSDELARAISYRKNLINNSLDGILGCDAQDMVVTFNRSLETMLGWGQDEVVGKMSLSRFFRLEDERRLKDTLISDAYGGRNRLMLFETNIIGKSGQTVPVQVSGTALKDQDQTTNMVFFFRDLREVRRLEREMADKARILHQDKMMSLGRLAASVAHEINNPLSGVLNYIRLMSKKIDRGPLDAESLDKFKRYLELVESETSRCAEIVSSLLTFSRKSPTTFGRLRIDSLIDRCALLSQHKLQLTNIVLQKTCEPDLPPIDGDFNQLQQSVINLIFNAIDAMPEGGQLDLAGYLDRTDGQVTIMVKDTGHGIKESDLPHIFEPFFTTKDEGYGVGLGLSTVYGIMEHHNGTVQVESIPGKGAVFYLKLSPAG